MARAFIKVLTYARFVGVLFLLRQGCLKLSVLKSTGATQLVAGAGFLTNKEYVV